MSSEDLWREVVSLALQRKATYDTQAITEEIESIFGPASLREVPADELERLFQKHETFVDRPSP